MAAHPRCEPDHGATKSYYSTPGHHHPATRPHTRCDLQTRGVRSFWRAAARLNFRQHGLLYVYVIGSGRAGCATRAQGLWERRCGSRRRSIGRGAASGAGARSGRSRRGGRHRDTPGQHPRATWPWPRRPSPTADALRNMGAASTSASSTCRFSSLARLVRASSETSGSGLRLSAASGTVGTIRGWKAAGRHASSTGSIAPAPESRPHRTRPGRADRGCCAGLQGNCSRPQRLRRPAQRRHRPASFTPAGLCRGELRQLRLLVALAGGVTGPVTDRLAYRLDGVYAKRDGFVQDVISGRLSTGETVIWCAASCSSGRATRPRSSSRRFRPPAGGMRAGVYLAADVTRNADGTLSTASSIAALMGSISSAVPGGCKRRGVAGRPLRPQGGPHAGPRLPFPYCATGACPPRRTSRSAASPSTSITAWRGLRSVASRGKDADFAQPRHPLPPRRWIGLLPFPHQSRRNCAHGAPHSAARRLAGRRLLRARGAGAERQPALRRGLRQLRLRPHRAAQSGAFRLPALWLSRHARLRPRRGAAPPRRALPAPPVRSRRRHGGGAGAQP